MVRTGVSICKNVTHTPVSVATDPTLKMQPFNKDIQTVRADPFDKISPEAVKEISTNGNMAAGERL